MVRDKDRTGTGWGQDRTWLGRGRGQVQDGDRTGDDHTTRRVKAPQAAPTATWKLLEKGPEKPEPLLPWRQQAADARVLHYLERDGKVPLKCDLVHQADLRLAGVTVVTGLTLLLHALEGLKQPRTARHFRLEPNVSPRPSPAAAWCIL